MIFTPASRDVAILANLVQTLQQIRPGGTPVQPIAVPSGTTSVQIYTDSGRTNLLATDSSPQITTVNNRTFYTPSDAVLNNATGLSTTQCQSLYYFTCHPSDTLLTYRNVDNMLFQSVVVSSKPDPKYAAGSNVAILVPRPAKTVDKRTNDDLSQVLLDWDLQVRLNVPNWQQLSEQVRMNTFMGTSNMIRLALMADRYRGGHATLYDANIDGTYVSELTPIDSKDTMKGKMRIRSAYWTSPTAY